MEFILFCGNYGDPLLHPDILEIFSHIRKHHGNLRLIVHSNASFGTLDFWSDLARYFNTPGSFIKFSIDGLKESHEKFRLRTNWDRILENARAFISSNGNAVWKMIEFSYNKSEIEPCAALSKQMGFKKFDLRKNNYPGLDEYISNNRKCAVIPDTVKNFSNSLEQLKTWHLNHLAEKPFDKISCKSLERRTFFLDSKGHVWPCCWVGGLPYRPEHELREWFKTYVQGSYALNFNSLHEHSFQEILMHPWFLSDLEKSWDHKQNGPHPLISTCARTCGVCSKDV